MHKKLFGNQASLAMRGIILLGLACSNIWFVVGGCLTRCHGSHCLNEKRGDL
jgi:hypothetical protein